MPAVVFVGSYIVAIESFGESRICALMRENYVLKDVKDGELVIEYQKDNFEEASDSETISKAGDAEATSNSVLTLDPPITYFT